MIGKAIVLLCLSESVAIPFSMVRSRREIEGQGGIVEVDASQINRRKANIVEENGATTVDAIVDVDGYISTSTGSPEEEIESRTQEASGKAEAVIPGMSKMPPAPGSLQERPKAADWKQVVGGGLGSMDQRDQLSLAQTKRSETKGADDVRNKVVEMLKLPEELNNMGLVPEESQKVNKLLEDVQACVESAQKELEALKRKVEERKVAERLAAQAEAEKETAAKADFQAICDSAKEIREMLRGVKANEVTSDAKTAATNAIEPYTTKKCPPKKTSPPTKTPEQWTQEKDNLATAKTALERAKKEDDKELNAATCACLGMMKTISYAHEVQFTEATSADDKAKIKTVVDKYQKEGAPKVSAQSCRGSGTNSKWDTRKDHIAKEVTGKRNLETAASTFEMIANEFKEALSTANQGKLSTTLAAAKEKVLKRYQISC